MTTLLGLGGTVLLFVAFGLLRRGREPETRRCAGCAGCGAGRCDLEEGSSDGIS